MSYKIKNKPLKEKFYLVGTDEGMYGIQIKAKNPEEAEDKFLEEYGEELTGDEGIEVEEMKKEEVMGEE